MVDYKKQNEEAAYLAEQNDLRERAKAAALAQAKAAGALPGIVDQASKKAQMALRANAAKALAQTAGALGGRLGGGFAGAMEQSAKTQGINQAQLESESLLQKNAAEQEAAASNLDYLKFVKEAGSELSDRIAGKNEAEAYLQQLANKYADADLFGDFGGSEFRSAAEAYAQTIPNPEVKKYVLGRIHAIIKSNE